MPSQLAFERFSRDLDALIKADARIGIAVSGGPDSLALLLFAAFARPGGIEAATVDHALRPESSAEAVEVHQVCRGLGVDHAILTAEWTETPRSAIQERARLERYRLLARWAKSRNLDAVATGHHLDDQAETFVMRLARGSGVRGLAGMRAISLVPASDVPLLRPLLGWHKAELDAICATAGLRPISDPSNADDRYERVRVRQALEDSGWLRPDSLAASAAHLRAADDALDWATRQEWDRAVTNGGAEIVYTPIDAPAEIRRRIIQAAVARLASEGSGNPLKGREVDSLISALAEGRRATIRGVLCAGGSEWRFKKAPPRR